MPAPNHVFAVRPHKDRLVPKYLAAVLSSWYARAYFQQTSKQTTNLASTNQNTIGSFRVPLPNPTEQAIILSRLAVDLRSVEQSIKQAEREIHLIREYQGRLIADVVTGQHDVRAAAGGLPTEVEEPEGVLEPDADEEADDLLEEVSEDA